MDGGDELIMSSSREEKGGGGEGGETANDAMNFGKEEHLVTDGAKSDVITMKIHWRFIKNLK